MDRRTIQLNIAGQNYRVVSSAGEGELQRLAATVSDKVAELVPRGRPAPAQAVLLAAMALAHELEAERAKREDLERRARDLLRRVLVRIDDALESGSQRRRPRRRAARRRVRPRGRRRGRARRDRALPKLRTVSRETLGPRPPRWDAGPPPLPRSRAQLPSATRAYFCERPAPAPRHGQLRLQRLPRWLAATSARCATRRRRLSAPRRRTRRARRPSSANSLRGWVPRAPCSSPPDTRQTRAPSRRWPVLGISSSGRRS